MHNRGLQMRILSLKMFFQTFIVINLLICVNSQSGESGIGFSSLDLTEIESVHYDVNIGGIPILEQTLASEEKYGIPMTNKFGQKYFCTLPKPTLNDDEDEEIIDENGHKSTAKKVVNVPAEIPELLAPMAKEPCLFKTKDWWTYEICYHKVAKQYHVEDGRPSGAIMILGYYDHDLEWPVAKGSEEKEDPLQTLRHHKQFYTNGSKCDLTGEMRKTEVRYECDPLAVVDFISSVDEPQSCEYVMVVRTSKICSIPQLKPPPTKKPKPIDCSPILSEIEYKKYEQYQIAKQKYVEKKAKEQKLFQRDHMLKLLDGEDLTGIDIDTDEGLAIVESRVGERMAEKLVSELGLMFDPSKKGSRRKTFGSLEDLFKTDDTKENPIEEFRAPNGQMQSRLKKNENPNWDSLSKSKQKAEAKSKKTKVTKEVTEQKADKKTDKKKADKSSSVNLDPRSDLSDEDEMLDVLLDTFRRMSGDENTELKLLKEELKAIRETVSDSIEDILEETENEMNMKLDGLDRHHAIDQLSHTLNELMNKLDETEADIARMNSKIEKVQEVIDSVEDEGVFHHKNEKKVSDKPAKKKDFLFDKEEDENDLDDDDDSEDTKKDKKKVNVKVTNFSHAKISGLPESSPSEERVIKHLESAIKEKLEHSGLDTGGRQIEVKLITATSYPGGGENGDLDNQLDGDVQADEARQIQHMIYNLMIGDHVGYQDIDTQRKSEKNYKFSFDESELILDDDNADEGDNVKKEYEEKDENKELKEEVK